MKLLSLRVGISVLLVLFGVIWVSLGQDKLENLPDLEGKIAFVGDDFNIYTIDLTSGDVHQLSEGGQNDLNSRHGHGMVSLLIFVAVCAGLARQVSTFLFLKTVLERVMKYISHQMLAMSMRIGRQQLAGLNPIVRI